MGNPAGFSKEIGAVPLKLLSISTLIFFLSPLAVAQTCIEPSDLAGQDGERDFQQIRQLEGVPRPLISNGRVSFSSDEVIWTVTSPLAIVTHISANGMTQSIEGSAPEPVGAGGADNPLLDQSGLLDLLRGDLSQIDRLYDVEQQQNEASWALTMSPLNAEMAKYVDRVYVNGCDAVRGVSLHQANGDVISITFKEGEE